MEKKKNVIYKFYLVLVELILKMTCKIVADDIYLFIVVLRNVKTWKKKKL